MKNHKTNCTQEESFQHFIPEDVSHPQLIWDLFLIVGIRKDIKRIWMDENWH